MKNLLFIGDSLTDAGRDRTDEKHIGDGYVKKVDAKLAYEEPGAYYCRNRGYNGYCVADLFPRVYCDVLVHDPVCVTVTMGFNDTNIPQERFERFYDMLLAEMRRTLPSAHFILWEPFCIHGSATDERFDTLRTALKARAEGVRRLAKIYGATVIPMQERMDALAAENGPQYWTWDGVHPTPAGAELMSDVWLETFRSLEA